MTVDLNDSPSVFNCTSERTGFEVNEGNIAHGEITVTVSTRGDVTWGLTIASTPLTAGVEG